MITSKEINLVYEQFLRDVKAGAMPPKIIITFQQLENSIARVGKILPEYFELFLNEDIFSKENFCKEYLVQILYHEFMHVKDKFLFLKHIKNNKQHAMFLFPYTEYHAAQVEMVKTLNLFSIPLKIISRDTVLYGRYGIITLKDYIDEERRLFVQMNEKLINNPNIDTIKNITYLLAYNIGYMSILKKYGINNELPLKELYPFVSNEFEELKDLLLNKIPTDTLCLQTYGYMFNLTNKMTTHFVDNK